MLPKCERMLYLVGPPNRYQNHIVTILVDATTHCRIDSAQAVATLFLHEDLLARTLAFELELQQWRRTELLAGRKDPGRPRYEDVFGVSDNCASHPYHLCLSKLFCLCCRHSSPQCTGGITRNRHSELNQTKFILPRIVLESFRHPHIHFLKSVLCCLSLSRSSIISHVSFP